MMTRCPITYAPVESTRYSAAGLKLLDKRLLDLAPLAFTAEQQRKEALRRAGKMSIQGIQLKLSAILNPSQSAFDIVDRNGTYILKPPSADYPELPENEDLTMRLAATVGIEVPLHGLIYSADGSMTYFIRRFDRVGKERVPVEDFAQLSGGSRDTKYSSSMEKVASVVEQFCTFPALEKLKLFERTLFSFLVGNEDMHLKNFSLISRGAKIELSPAYDLLNSTIALESAQEEMALPLAGKKSRLTHRDLFTYFAIERLRLNEQTISNVQKRFSQVFPKWTELLRQSFLSPEMKASYERVLVDRWERMKL